MNSIHSSTRSALVSFFVFLFVLVIFTTSETNSAFGRLSTIALPVSLCFSLFFFIRGLSLNSVAKQKDLKPIGSTLSFDSAAPRGWMTSAQDHALKIQETISTRDDDELIAAHVHPDSSAHIRILASQELSRRGFDPADIKDWMPPAERLAVPSALRPGLSPTAYLAAVRTRALLVSLSRVFLIAAVACSIIETLNKKTLMLSPSFLWLPSILIPLTLDDRTRKNFGIVAVGLLVTIILIWLTTWSGPGSGSFLVASLAMLPAGFVLSHGSRARVLLLRPFGKTAMSSALKKIVWRYIGPLGLTFTLSDRNYRISTTLELMRLFGAFRHLVAPLLRPSIRIATVWNEASYRGLARTLAGNVLLDLESLYSGGQAFNVANANNWWKNCIDLLLHSTDIVVMDISRVQEGSAWEIVRLVRREAFDRTVFIAHVDYSDHAKQALEAHIPNKSAPRIFLYREDGRFLDVPAFERAIEGAISTKLGNM